MDNIYYTLKFHLFGLNERCKTFNKMVCDYPIWYYPTNQAANDVKNNMNAKINKMIDSETLNGSHCNPFVLKKLYYLGSNTNTLRRIGKTRSMVLITFYGFIVLFICHVINLCSRQTN